jgi:hypothetical protein
MSRLGLARFTFHDPPSSRRAQVCPGWLVGSPGSVGVASEPGSIERHGAAATPSTAADALPARLEEEAPPPA